MTSPITRLERMMGGRGDVRIGWACPRCGWIYSPDSAYCPSCAIAANDQRSGDPLNTSCACSIGLYDGFGRGHEAWLLIRSEGCSRDHRDAKVTLTQSEGQK